MSTEVGIRAFLSKSGGVGGEIKKEPEDFLVEEIRPDGTIIEIGKHIDFKDEDGDYIHFTLEKKNWGTMRAVKTIARRCGISRKRFKFAGTKDRRCVSTQRVSAWKLPREKLERVNIKDIEVRDFSTGKEPINLGDSSGNRFTILIRNADSNARENAEKIGEELGGKAPNFFGTQRFGMRLNNHKVGKHILKGEFKEAAMEYLCGPGDRNEEAANARKELKETGDYQKALETFPKHLGYEKSMLNHLIKTPTDYIGAMRELPKKLRWMLIHAYQGYVFNLALSRYIEEGEIPETLPLVGYATKPDKATKEILESEGIRTEDLRVPAMPEMSSEGAERKTLIEFSGFEIVDFKEEESNLWVRFSLPPGAYATVLLRELMK